MSQNVIEVSNVVAKSMTQFIQTKSPLYMTSNHDYVESMRQQMYMTGGTIQIKIPGYPEVQTGLTNTVQGIQDLIVPYTLTENDIYSVTRALTMFQQIFKISGGAKALTTSQKQAIVDNYAMPSYLRMESKLETVAVDRLKTTAYLSPIDTVEKLGGVNTFSSISSVNTMMNLLKLTKNDRTMMMNEFDGQYVADSLQNMFNEKINTRITETSRIGTGTLAGLELYSSPEMYNHIAGPLAGTTGMTISNVSADGKTITITGVSSTTAVLVKAGDRISIPSVHLVSTGNRQVLSYKLVVTAAADANGDGSGNVQVTLSYPLMASGEHINVDSLPAIGAAVYVFPSHKMNFAYTTSGLSVIPVPLDDIYGAANSSTVLDNRCPVKVWLQGAVLEASNNFRIALMAGFKAFAPYVIALPSAL